MTVVEAAATCLGALNLAAFIIMGADKAAAGSGRRRAPEKVLLAFTVCGAGAGILLGGALFRHKTRKDGLMALFWTITTAEILLAAAVYSAALF